MTSKPAKTTSTRKTSKHAAKATGTKPHPQPKRSPQTPSKTAVEVAYTVGSKHLWPPIKDGALLIAAAKFSNLTVTPVGASRALLVDGGTAAARKAAAAALDAYVNGAEPALRKYDATRPDVIREMNRTKEGRAQRLFEERLFFLNFAEQQAKPKRPAKSKAVA